MPYSPTFSHDRYSSIEKYIGQLGELDEGKTLLIDLSSIEEADKTRWLLYDYLHHISPSSSYKIKRIQRFLLIGRKKPLLSNIIVLKERSLESKFDYWIKKLLEAEKPREVLSRLCLSEEFSFGALSLLAGEYSRIMQE